MADITIDGGAGATFNENTMPKSLVWTSPLIGYIFYIDGNSDPGYKKTTDGGATWGAFVALKATTCANISVWYDKWTKGDTGTKIHVIFSETPTDDVWYDSVNTGSADALNGNVAVYLTSTWQATAGWQARSLDITKSVGGNIYVSAAGNTSSAGLHFFRSIDGGVNWTERTTMGESITIDKVLLLPGSYADNQDINCVFFDLSANQITLKVYDDSANSWAEGAGTITVSSADAGDNLYFQYEAVVRHSDNHIILIAWNETESATGDVICYDITDKDTFTAKTDILSNQASAGISLLINQQNNDLYASYLFPNTTFAATVDTVYKKSTDGGATWGSQAAMSADVADDYRWISAGHSVGTAGGKFQPAWFNDDLNDLLTNTTNGISIAAASSSAIKTINGLAKASVKTINGLAIASVKSIEGLA